VNPVADQDGAGDGDQGFEFAVARDEPWTAFAEEAVVRTADRLT
jgi:hypothetical protein